MFAPEKGRLGHGKTCSGYNKRICCGWKVGRAELLLYETPCMFNVIIKLEIFFICISKMHKCTKANMQVINA